MRRRARTGTHSLVPSVNLLSPWMFEALATRRLRQRFAIGAGVLVLLLGASWAVQHLRISQAERLLTIEHAETSRLTAQTDELAPVRTYVATVGHQQTMVQEAMANEVHLSRVLTGLRDATPRSAEVESMAVTLTPPAAASDSASDPAAASASDPAASSTGSLCPGPDPFNTKIVVGCLTLTGSADSRATVCDFVVRNRHDLNFVEPIF